MKQLFAIIALCLAAFSACAADLPHSQKLINYIGIGNGAITAENPRAINRGNIPGDDWNALWKAQQPLVDAGLKRWIIWMPFGTDNPARTQWFQNGDEYYQLPTNLRIEGYSRAKEAGYATLCTTFLPATKAFTADKSREVIAYIGTIIGAPEWECDGSTTEASAHSRLSLEKRMDAELQIYLDAGCSLAFDSTCLLSKHHWFFDYCQKLKEKGVKVYIETWPLGEFKHLAGENCIALTDQLKNYKPSAYGEDGFLDPQKITGERQAWLVDLPPNGGKYAPWYSRIVPAMLADPNIDSVAFYVGPFLKEGGKLTELEELETDWRAFLP